MALLYNNISPECIVLIDQSKGDTLTRTTATKRLSGTATAGTTLEQTVAGILGYPFTIEIETTFPTSISQDNLIVSDVLPMNTVAMWVKKASHWALRFTGHTGQKGGRVTTSAEVVYPTMDTDGGTEVEAVLFNDDLIWGSPFQFTFHEDSQSYSVEARRGVALPDPLYIPSEHRDLPVIYIEPEGFANVEVDEIHIPPSIKEIYGAAFYGSTASSIVFDDYYNSNLTFISDEAFCDCMSLSSINIPDQVTYIGAYAFADCNNLSRIHLPDALESIGAYALAWTNINTISIPEGVSYMGDGLLEETPIEYLYISAFAMEWLGLEQTCLNETSDTTVETQFITGASTSEISWWPSDFLSRSSYEGQYDYEVTISQATERLGYGYSGENCSISWDGRYPTENINIPIEKRGYRVNQISDHGFEPYNHVTGEIGTSNMTKFTIPLSVDKIGSYAFANNPNLSEAHAPGFWLGTSGAGTVYVDGYTVNSGTLSQYLKSTHTDKEWTRDENITAIIIGTITSTTASSSENLAYNVQITSSGGSGTMPVTISAQGYYNGGGNAAQVTETTITAGQTKTVKVEVPKYAYGGVASARSVGFTVYSKYKSLAVVKTITVA